LLVPPKNVENWRGPYIQKNYIPKDPWGNPYVYRCPGRHNPDGYDLHSLGPDGQEGGGDDIDNWTGSNDLVVYPGARS
jgi:general secretion pathway protein G